MTAQYINIDIHIYKQNYNKNHHYHYYVPQKGKIVYAKTDLLYVNLNCVAAT